MCSHTVGKDSLKCSACFRWVHFSCSSLTRANFHKSVRLAPPWVGIALLVSMGTLPLPSTSKRPPTLSLQLRPHSHPPPTCSDLVDSSLPLPSHPLLLNTCPLSAFVLPSTPPKGTKPVYNSPPHPRRTPRLPQNLRILQWNAGGLSPTCHAELVAFLSNNQYDLILLQETHLSATGKFHIPGYSALRLDRTSGRQGPVFSGGHNTGGGVLTLIHSDLAFSPVSVSFLSSQDPYLDYICVKFLFSSRPPFQFLNLCSPPIRSTPSDSRTRTFSPDILPGSHDTFILGDFNAHHPSWGRLIPPGMPGGGLVCWIASSGLGVLGDPASPALLHHSTGSRSSPHISLAPASLAPHCEWRSLPGLDSDHLPVEIALPLSSLSPQCSSPKFNYKKAHWDVCQLYVVEHLPSLNVGAVGIHQAARPFSLFLVEAAGASVPFGHSPRAWWSQEAKSAEREQRRARSKAHWSEAHRLRHIDASRKASSVISRA